MKKTLKSILITISAIFILIISVALISNLIQKSNHQKKENYKDAMELLDHNNYREAYDIFKSLRRYEDSEQLESIAALGIEMYEIKTLMNEEKWEEALDGFSQLNIKIEEKKKEDLPKGQIFNVNDIQRKNYSFIETCEDNISYQEFEQLFNTDQLDKALAVCYSIQTTTIADQCLGMLYPSVIETKPYNEAGLLCHKIKESDLSDTCMRELSHIVATTIPYEEAESFCFTIEEYTVKRECLNEIFSLEADRLLGLELYQEAWDLAKNSLSSDYDKKNEVKDEARDGKKYLAAKDLFEQGLYEEAYEAFKDISGFKDARSWSYLSNDNAKYQNAKNLLEKQEYHEAIIILEQLDDFEDSQELILANQENLYLECKQNLQEEDYLKAKGCFTHTGDYKDSIELFETATNFYDYYQTTRAIEIRLNSPKSYDGYLLELIKTLDQLGTFNNADQKSSQYKQQMYQQAINHIAEEEFYKAYLLLRCIEDDFLDVPSLIAQTPQKIPETSVLFKNENYTSDDIRLKIQTNHFKTHYYYIEILDNEILVATIFINPEEDASISIPADYFTFHFYSGTTWYGEKDKFGNSNSEFDSEGFIFKTEENYTTFYELKLDYSNIHDNFNIYSE